MLGQWLAQKYRRKIRKLSRNKARIGMKIARRFVVSGDTSLKNRAIARVVRLLAPANRYLPLASYADQSTIVAELAPPTGYVTEAPREVDATPETETGEMPPTMARLFSNVETHPLSSAIATKDRIAIPPLYVGRPDLLITDGEFLLEQDRGMGVVFCPSPVRTEQGIMLFGAGATNWYHWLIETLPAAYLAESLPGEFDNFPLLVAEEAQKYESFRASLALFSSRRNVVKMAPGVPTTIDQLIQIDGAVSGPMNLAAGRWPVPTDYSQNGDVLNRYRAAILDRLSINESPPERRIFLARGNDRRNYNQSQLIEIAEKYDFEPVYPEQLSFREQVATFASAAVVVGPSGAAFANLLFCQKNTRGLTWLLPQYRGFCAYSNLANVVGMRLNYLFVTPQTEIRSTFDAYSASYILEGDRFETALKRLS